MVLAPDKVKIEKWKAENAELAKAAEEAPEIEEDLNDVEEDETVDSVIRSLEPNLRGGEFRKQPLVVMAR